MQVVLGLVLLSFIFWYSTPNGDKSGVLAKVNGETITDTLFMREYRMATRQYGGALSEEQEDLLRARVRQQLIQDEVLKQEATRLGLVVSDSEVARALLDVEIFRGDDGRFDQRLYQGFLRGAGFTRTDYEERLRDSLLRDKLQRLVFFGATISDPLVRDYFVRNNTRMEVSYVRLNPAEMVGRVSLDAGAVTSWIAENPDWLKAEYDGDFARLYDVPEKLAFTTLELDVLHDGLGVAELLSRAKLVLQRAQAGEDFDALVREWSDQVVPPMEATAVPQLAEEVSAALAGLEVGQLSAPVVTDSAVLVLRLDRREPAHVIPLEEVQDTIAERILRQQKAPGLASTLADDLLAQWIAGGAAPQALLSESALRVTSSGPFLVGEGPGKQGPPAQMVEAATAAEVGAVLPEVYESNGVLYVGALTSREDPDMTLFEVEKEQVREEALRARRQELFQHWEEDLVARADIR